MGIQTYWVYAMQIADNPPISPTIWLFNTAMENPNHKWRFSSLGKSSISMGHGFHGYVK